MTIINFNLMASTFKYGEDDAREELLDLLALFGDYQPESQSIDINGIVIAHTNLDLFQVLDSLRHLIKKEPWQIRYIHRVIPIESVVNTKLDELANAAKKLTPKMQSQDTFRITVERRHTLLSPADIIATLGSQIDNKVNLKKPDWIVLVEIIGALAGISILKPDQIFSSVIEKRNTGNNDSDFDDDNNIKLL
jgi:tRNA acetyltransferase TAN1